MSCSIRQDNVNGARCSFDGIYSLALDCVKPLLDKKTRTVTNLISVIIMRVQHEHVEIVMSFQLTGRRQAGCFTANS